MQAVFSAAMRAGAVLGVLLPAVGAAQPAFYSGSELGPATAAAFSVPLSRPTRLGDVLLVGVDTAPLVDVTPTVTDNAGNAYALLQAERRFAADKFETFLFEAHDLDAGASALTVAFSSPVTAAVLASEYGGVLPNPIALSFDAGLGVNAVTAEIVIGPAATRFPALVYALAFSGPPDAFTGMGAPYTTEMNVWADTTGDRLVPGPGVYAAPFNSSNLGANEWVTNLVAFDAIDGGSPLPAQPIANLGCGCGARPGLPITAIAMLALAMRRRPIRAQPRRARGQSS